MFCLGVSVLSISWELWGLPVSWYLLVITNVHRTEWVSVQSDRALIPFDPVPSWSWNFPLNGQTNKRPARTCLMSRLEVLTMIPYLSPFVFSWHVVCILKKFLGFIIYSFSVLEIMPTALTNARQASCHWTYDIQYLNVYISDSQVSHKISHPLPPSNSRVF